MAETIADYLVRLGFKIDKGEEARFTATLDKLDKTVRAVAASLAGAAASITAAVVAVSAQFDQLYFASQRTGTTVTNMKALQYAFSQVGGTAQQASSVIEGLSTALRTNPQGVGGYLHQLGVLTSQNGKIRDSRDVLESFYQTVKNHPYQLQAIEAGNIGISEKDWQTYVQHHDEIRKFEDEAKKRYSDAGVDPDKAAEASNKLMTSIRQLMADLGVLLDKIVIDLQPRINEILKAIGKWFHDHKDQIVSAINTLIDAVVAVTKDFGKLVDALKPVTSAFGHLADLIGGHEGGIKTAMEALVAYMAISWLPRFKSIFGSIGLLAGAFFGVGAYNEMYHPGTNPDGSVKGPYGTTMNPSSAVPDSQKGPAANDPVADYMSPGNTLSRVWNGIIGWASKTFASGKTRWRPKTSDATSSSSAANTPPDPEPAAISSNPDLVKVTTKSGQYAWVHKDYAPQFQGFVNDLEATGYKIGSIGGYNNRNIAGTNRLSWHARGMAIDINPDQNEVNGSTDMPDNTGDLAKKWGLGWGMNWRKKKDPMHFSTGPNEGGRLLTPDELKTLSTLPDKSSALFSPDNYLGGNSSRSASLSQKTDITILGSTDPAGTAHTLGNAQRRLNSDLLRNTTAAFA